MVGGPADENVHVFPASFAQQRLWLVQQLDPANPFYVIPMSFRLGGLLDVSALHRGLNEIVARHEALRTTFALVDDAPVQVVTPHVEMPLPLVDLSGLDHDTAERERCRLAEEMARQPLDLEAGPIIRCALVRVTDDDHHLMINIHHAMCDAWSQGIFFRELGVLYEAFLNGAESPLSEPELQYPDYAVWQQEWLQGENLDRQVDYWREQLRDAPRLYELPLDRPRQPVQRYEGAWHRFRISAEVSARLKELANQENGTLFIAALAAFKALLARSTGHDDVVVGSPIAGRTRPELESVFGFFINMLPLRTDVSGDPTFRELLRRVRTTCFGGYEHQDLPFEKLVEELDPERDLSHNPLFQIVFVVQNAPAEPAHIGDLSLEATSFGQNGTAKFDLTVFLIEDGDGIDCSIEYAADLFDPETIARLAARYSTLLGNAVAQPDRPISRLPMLDAAELESLRDWGDGYRQDVAPMPRPVHALIAEAAERDQDRVAIVSAHGSLTYRELDERSNRIAHVLRDWGVGPETRVGVCLPRTPELLVALLAVFKAGGAYVPLDAEYPKRRLEVMVSDAQPAVLLVTSRSRGLFDGFEGRMLALDGDAELIRSQSSEPIPNSGDVEPHNTAYVLYTSGSTGVPKGSIIQHRSLMNLLGWSRSVLEEQDLDGMLASSSVCFDASVWELWAPLALGGTMVLVDNVLALGSLPDDVRSHIRLVNTVPSAAIELVRAGWLPSDVWTVTTGGEQLPADTVRQLYALGVHRVLNLYGVAEATVYSTFNPLPRDIADRPVPIGGPLPNTRVYVLDRNLDPVPVGMPGELFVAGECVGVGYAARPRLTAERFLPDTQDGRPGARMYRTGDVVRWRSDATIEFLGRTDYQVKVRGFRIELGEVEAALSSHPSVSEAAVTIVDETGGGKVLVGCYVSSDATLDATAMRLYLKEMLPEYMVPTRLLLLDALPRTVSGKVDRAAMPAAGAASQPATVTRRAEPRNRVERAVLDAWTTVLEREDVGINDNFFDLGGHSLLLLRVHRALAESLGRDIRLVDLFRYSTVATLAAYLKETSPRTDDGGSAGEAADSSAAPTAAHLTESTMDTTNRPSAAEDSASGAADRSNAVAVVGMNCRFPGADGPEQFWRNLLEGIESIATFSEDEMRAAGIEPDERFVPRSAEVDDIAGFDAGYFGYSPREADLLDPAHRLLLECAAGALDRAGYDPKRYEGLIGVYAGVGFSDYLLCNVIGATEALSTVNDLQVLTAVDKDYAANRVSYKLDLRGPAFTVQSACSTSLVAAHVAYQALVAGECDIALAGGANVRIPNVGYPFIEGGVLSPDGRCRSFDAESLGTVPGNGVGVVVLKRLADALADGDVIHAVIIGSGVSNDGSGKVGYTAPSVEGEAIAMRRALRVAGIDASTIGMVEAHGTGTPVGDPIEVTGLAEAYREFGASGQGVCALGSVKSNVGHLGAAAGVAGLIKAVLSVQHGVIPPSLHFEKPNPNLGLESTPFSVNTEVRQWPEGVRRASVNSLGVGGTNAHMIVEQPPARPATTPGRGPQLVPLSAKTASALETLSAAVAEHASSSSDDLADVAHTLQVGRTAFAHRRALIATSRAELATLLREPADGLVFTGSRQADAFEPATVLVLADDATIEPGALRGLYWRLPAFRRAVDECCELVTARLGVDLREVLFLGDGPIAEGGESTAARFVTSYALARSLRELGCLPADIVAAGVGECVVGCLAGALTLAEALDLAIHSGAADGSTVPAVAGREPEFSWTSASDAGIVRRAEAADPSYWQERIWDTGMLVDALEPYCDDPDQLVLHVGADEALDDVLGERVSLLPGSGEPADRCFLSAVARLWVAGLEVQWSVLHEGQTRGRVILPAYPFEHARHWITPSQDAGAPQAPSRAAGGREKDPARWFYLPSWELALRPEAGEEEPPAHLVVTDEGGLGAELADWLRAGGAQVVTVVAGSRFEELTPDTYTLDVTAADQWTALVGRLAERSDGFPERIVHCLAAAETQPTDIRLRPFYGLAYLGRALAAHPMPGRVDMCVISASGLPVSGDEDLVPEHGMVGGLCRVLPQELPSLRCRHIDVTVPSEPVRRARLVEAIGAELAGGHEATVAYRGTQRWVQRYVSAPLPATDTATRLREGGCYLIVGGLGHLGRVIAEHLTERVHARIGVIRRGGGDDPRLVERLEQAGARIVTATADVADRDRFAAAVAHIEAELGEINGVFHVAGVVGEGTTIPLPELTESRCEAHFSGKVDGPRVIAEVFAERDLDFVLLNSSVSAALGGIGFAAYAAANVHLDLFAHQRTNAGATPWSALDWEGWLPDTAGRDKATTSGAAGEKEAGSDTTWLGAALADLAISDAEGRDILGRVLASELPARLVNSTGDIQARLDQWVNAGWRDEQTDDADAIRHPRPELPTEYVAPRTTVEQRLAEIWQRMLNLDKVGVFDDFFDLGGHSLAAIQLVEQVHRVFGQSLGLHAVLDATTIDRLGALLDRSSEETPEKRTLVTLRQTPGAPNFFCVHPLGGTVMCYRALAEHLGDGWSFHALQAPGLFEDVENCDTVEALAERYLEEILAVQPDGRYYVGGWSVGATISYEIAQRLRGAGKEVAVLAIIEAEPPHPSRPLVTNDADVIQALLDSRTLSTADIPPLPDEMRTGSTSQRIERFSRWAHDEGLLTPDTDAEQIARLYLVARNNLDVWAAYEPKPYPGEVHVFRGDLQPEWVDRTLGWGELGDSVHGHDVPGDHQSAIEEPCVAVLAERLRSVLEHVRNN